MNRCQVAKQNVYVTSKNWLCPYGMKCRNVTIETIPILRQQKDYLGGWVKKKVRFADVKYCIYADKVGEGGPKRPKNILT